MRIVIMNTAPKIVMLGRRGSVEAVARGAREAMLDFCNGVHAWDKRSLARWLTDRYAPLAQREDDGARDVVPESRSRAADASEPRVLQIALDARHTLLGALRLSSRGVGVASAWRMLRVGALVPCEDEGRDRGWMPRAVSRMSLRDRVLSLWAVDYLASGKGYGAGLYICRTCGFVCIAANTNRDHECTAR